jgi:phytoene dehydrogenase-like protein
LKIRGLNPEIVPQDTSPHTPGKLKYYPTPVRRNVVIVGGGISGLTASIYLARGGRTVTLFEKARVLGGRAVTHLRRGFRFNLGAHTFHRGGPAAAVCRELGIPIRGGSKKPWGTAVWHGEMYRLPSGWLSLLSSGLLGARGKRELLSAMHSVRKLPAGVPAGSLAAWLDSTFTDRRAREVCRALIRTATLCDDEERESAAASLAQFRGAMRGSVFVDEGWQKIVDALHSAAVSSGVHFVTSSRVVGVEHDGRVRAVEIGGLELDPDRHDTASLAYPADLVEGGSGARVPADEIVLAVDPATARSLSGDAGESWNGEPVTAACLDVALRSLPDAKKALVVGIDEPVYAAAHSAYAQLTPKGGALVHAVRYHRGRTPSEQEIDGDHATRRDAAALSDEQQLEALLDRCQPGWRELVVHRRFLPAMTVSNAMSAAGTVRPPVRTAVEGLYLAGDWVGDEGLLSDASFASARAAARAILARS